MSGGNNVYKYITTGRKLAGEEALKFTLLEYMQKTTGVFNQNGIISKEEVKAMKQRAQTGEKNIWHGYISFDKEHSHLIDHPDKCIELLKQTFGEFFKDAGFDKDNMDLMAALHVDRRHHYHIHYVFWEKEPKVKNQRAAGYKYRAKGRIQMDAINKMVERVNNFALPDEIVKRRKEALALLSLNRDYLKAKSKDETRDLMEELAKELPKDKPWYYAARYMKPYREKIDKIVKVMIESDWELERADRKFRHELMRKEGELQDIMSNFYKRRVKSDMDVIINGESYEEDYPLPHIHTIEKLEWDYRRRLGNIVLGKVKYIRATPTITTKN
ncbi:MAG: relaxase MobL [Clostridia bacterium]|nr:relaxase MobL [Clostridia bacterium]